MALHDYNIEIAREDSYNSGDVVSMTATVTVEHPAGVLPTVAYEWIDHTGQVLGTDLSLSYIPAEDGWHSVQFSAQYESVPDNYARTISQDATFRVEEKQTITHSFNLGYTKALFDSAYSNMDIYRTLSGFPAWSSAHKNFFSNMSKLLSPLAEPISQTLDDLDGFIENNTNHDEVVRFGYRENQYEIISTEVPRMIKTEHGYCEYIGPHNIRSLESAPIRKLIKEDAGVVAMQDYQSDGTDSIMSFTYESTLYIFHPSASVEAPVEVSIRGFNGEGDTVAEKFSLYSNVPFETMNTYKAIFSVLSTEAVSISTYLDLSKHHSSENGINLQKRIAGVGGGYFEPKLEVDGKSILVLNSTRTARNDEFKFEIDHEPDSIFLNNLMDVAYLSDGKVYTSKLMLDYYSLSQENSSTNINDFIVLDYDQTSIGSDVRVTIKCDKIKEEFGSAPVRLSISNSDATVYLSPKLELTEDKGTWIDLEYANNYIAFSMPIQNSDPYVYKLELSNRPDSFIAMNYLMPLQAFEAASDVSKLFIYNKKMHCENTDASISTLEPVRLAFTSGVNRLYLFNDFADSELIYTNE
jgi:hypothetical protein